MADLQQAFMSLPPITRSLLALTAGVTIPPLLGLVKPYAIVFYWPAIRYKYQLWRLISPFFYAGTYIVSFQAYAGRDRYGADDDAV